MAEKKIPIGLNPAEEELEARVDSMMEPVQVKVIKTPDTKVEVTKPDVPASLPKIIPIDIFSDPKTAPEVPPDLLDKLAISGKTSSEPAEAPAGIANKVPQLIASTAPKPKPIVVSVPEEVEVSPEIAQLTTPEAAPIFEVAEMPATETKLEPKSLGDSTIEEILVPPVKLDDDKTEATIAAIERSDSDALLAAQDAMTQQAPVDGKSPKTKPVAKKRKSLFKRPWFYVLLIVLVLAAIIAIPKTRYRAVGLVVKQDVGLTIVDSKTSRPVSKASVVIDGRTVVTDVNGKLTSKLAAGNHKISVSKQYYADTSNEMFVGFQMLGPVTIQLTATGRQVPITITDKLTGKPIVGAEISVLNTSARTDSQGKALVALPTKTKTIAGKLKASGFNSIAATIQITDTVAAANSFVLTPAGKIYFLSNDKGTIDVVKSNLDGTDRQTVVKGTGKEDPNTTVLLASRDWGYSVLKAQRDSSQAALYLIDSSNDKLVEFDSGDANFALIGWSGHNFMYDVVRNGVATSQNSHELIKSYDAERGQLNQLDASQAMGDGTKYVYQGFYNFFVIDNQLIYNMQWHSSGGADLANKTVTIRGVQTNGQNKKDYQSMPAAGIGYVQAALATPKKVIYSAFNYDDNKTSFFEYDNLVAKPSTTINQASFNRVYPAYVTSPSGKLASWSEMRNGKSVVLLGDVSAVNPKLPANLAGYAAFGWYSESYLLVSKGAGELYILAANSSSAPIKLADFYKPAQRVDISTFGYGGL